jgi:hypothetical protein
MIVPTTKVVVGDDDGRLIPVWRALHLPDEVGGVLFAGCHRRVAGVFVVLAKRLYE